MADDIMSLNLYELIGTVSTASVKEITTAYRKKALSCHPDKNPDNPRAADLFRELKRALEILTDESARAAYDKVLNGRQQAKARLAQLDSKRRKFQEDLEAREAAYYNSRKKSSTTDEQKLKAEIERLQKEGSKLVEEEVELVKKQIYEQLYGKKNQNNEPGGARIKIKWKAAKDDSTNGGYNYDNLYQILFKHGDIEALVISSKKGRAMVEFKNKSDAVTAIQIEKGFFNNPLSLQGVWESDHASYSRHTYTTSSNTTGSFLNKPDLRNLFPMNAQNRTENTFPSFSSAPNIFTSQLADAERLVFNNIKREEERRKLIEQIKNEENDDNDESKEGKS